MNSGEGRSCYFSFHFRKKLSSEYSIFFLFFSDIMHWNGNSELVSLMYAELQADLQSFFENPGVSGATIFSPRYTKHPLRHSEDFRRQQDFGNLYAT